MGKPSKNKVPKITEEEYAAYVSSLKSEPTQDAPQQENTPPVSKNEET